MSPMVSIYASEPDAQAASSEAEQAGFDQVFALSPTNTAGREQEAVQAAIDAGCIERSQRRMCVGALQRGQSVVAINAPFGRGELAGQILDRHSPAEQVEPPPHHDPAPFSNFFGIPVLSDSEPATDLSVIQFTFGEPKVSRNAAPFSSRLGMKTLTAATKKNSSMGLPLLSRNAAPFSSMLNLPLLQRRKAKNSSFGLPLLSNKSTPLSKMFGLRVLSKRDEKK